MSRRIPPRRDRGFSLIIVFLLVMVMVGVAAAVAMTTQEDLAVSGQDREAKTAFYAAEYAVALAKDFLAGQAYDANTGWSALLAANGGQVCTPVGGATPGTVPKGGSLTLFTSYTPTGTGDPILFNYCVHNNAEDPSYFAAIPTGDTDDSKDGSHFVVVEAYGYYGTPPRAYAHLAVMVGGPTTAPIIPNNCYSQEGGCGQHQGSAGALESGISINTTIVKGL